ncbi:pyridoxamine 5'-phosphate oxidase family protein [Roseixanthobacter pseudopolyaromaticivorans]|uniref:pyridoxamine 5'-phosphate oxidase family protein n=1 Tax=Xanthobacteraceae TaxID=335928 RepID=UPI00372B0740
MQESAGAASKMEGRGCLIRDHLLEQHRDFFPLLNFIVFGTVDAEENAWATIREGQPGFLSAPDDRTLRVKIGPDPADPAEAGLLENRGLGVLGIEISTRRRNRLNGRLKNRKSDSFDVTVEQSFGNCAKYITIRNLVSDDMPECRTFEGPAVPAGPQHFDLVRNADTFFVATFVNGPQGLQVDVSHRGGERGFVVAHDDGTLRIPDYPGNLFFNTLGNIVVNGRAGLTFPDFAHGALLQLSGDARLDPAEGGSHTEASRFWTFTPRKGLYRPNSLKQRWMVR